MKKISVLIAFFAIGGNVIAQTVLPAVLTCSATLTSAGSPYIAQNDIVVEKGCSLVVESGVEIKMADSINIIIRGKADFQGTQSQPVYIHALDTTWGHIYLDSSEQHSVFNYVTIENGTNGTDGNNHFTTNKVAALTGYYSSFTVNNCLFRNNLKSIYAKHGNIRVSNCTFDSSNVGEKILVQFADSSIVENSTFYFTAGTGDAIDFDGLENGIIRNNLIYGGDADGIDIGQMDSIACNNMLISNNFIRDMGDKGISVGEGSTNIYIEKNLIIRCYTGIGVKDQSYAIIDRNTLYEDSLGIRCYDHFIGLGGGMADVTNTIIANSLDSAWYRDSTAVLNITYSISNTDTLPPGIGNLYGDPLFVSVANQDFHLTSLSPCVNKGDPNSAKDPDSSIVDIGAFYFDKLSGERSYLKQNVNRIFLFPNPANELINVKYNSEEKSMLMVFLRNIEGQIIFSESYTSFSGIYNRTIDLSSYSQGIFFLEIISGNEYDTKIIVRN